LPGGRVCRFLCPLTRYGMISRRSV
jgi:hypothetical protein